MIAGGAVTGEAVDMNLAKVASPPGEVVRTFAEGVKLLSEGQDINYEGVSGTIDFNEFGNVGVPAVRLMEVQSGEWRTKEVIDATNFPPS
jgi:ABC-type branched-subunit amino acid transport system substrate-binding protein